MKFLWVGLVTSVFFFCAYTAVFAMDHNDFDPALTYTISSQAISETPEAGASGVPSQQTSSTIQTPDVQATEVPTQNWVQRMFGNAQSMISSAGHSIVQGTRTFISGVSRIPATLFAHLPRRYKIALTIFGLVLPLIGGLIAKSPLFQSVSLVGQGVMSVLDLGLHAISGVVAGFQSLFWGSTFAQAYALNKKWIKKTFHRDIGDVRHDLIFGGLTIIAAAAIYFSPAIGARVGQVAESVAPVIQRLSIPLTAYAYNQAPRVIDETTRECQVPGQCDTPLDASITLGVNIVTNGLPDFEVDQGAISAKNALLKDSVNAGEEVVEEGVQTSSRISRVLSRNNVTTENVKDFWYKSTFGTIDQSIEYHLPRHANSYNKSLVEYTKDGLEFFEKNKENGVVVTLKDGSEGLYFKSRGVPGGYFTKSGLIVTFWYK